MSRKSNKDNAIKQANSSAGCVVEKKTMIERLLRGLICLKSENRTEQT